MITCESLSQRINGYKSALRLQNYTMYLCVHVCNIHLVSPGLLPCKPAGLTGCSQTPGAQRSLGSTLLAHSLSAVRLIREKLLDNWQTKD